MPKMPHKKNTALRSVRNRVKQAKAKQIKPIGDKEDENAAKRAKGYAIAFRLSTEFVAAPLIACFIGWSLDKAFNTKPFLMLLFFFLGVAAGGLNVVRAAKEINKNGR
ncbi:MAG: AtpZ/AtpI family protein [Parvibaculales bacterium]